MSLTSDPEPADPKEIGRDVEGRVVDALGLIRAADDPNAFYDAVTTGVIAPETVDCEVPVQFGVPLIQTGIEIETKGTRRRISNGEERSTFGRWVFKGRDHGQHAKLLDANAYYALTAYDVVDNARVLLAIAIIPASLVDEHLRDRWYSIDRAEGTIARLSWKHIFDDLDGGDGR
ncbi:hypothetical protein [Halobellus limi]|uniref:Restriction endonuclease n=1 Tax=Halobellus limi TaxID=699433 RepID=A0A1H5VWR8_9EURY|nr:hypothetical protein [Halobellus limi]QCC46594.1 hypothetical protein DV707_02295 [Halobellus limi]SEF91729.1 hypothetical protein SAMN04488133_1097 [Halobellus limi]